jgi:hypothetical protein
MDISNFTAGRGCGMRMIQVGMVWVLFSIATIAENLHGANEENAPGYRATYPTQVVQAEQLSIPPTHTRKGLCSYGDTTAFLSTNLSATNKGALDLIIGARRVHLGLGQKTAPRGLLYGIIGCNADYRGIENWDWIGNIVIQPKLSSTNIARASRYIAALNGRFAASPSMGLHVGFYTEIGMRASIVHPLIGIDYFIGSWLLQAVYPIKAGISYQGIQSHVFSLMVRPIYTALRLHKALYNRPGIGCYSATGLEFRWDYVPTKRWSTWAAIGSTMFGSLSLGDKNNNHRHHIRLHRSPYINIGITYGL